jgi:hypothetical protein
MKTHEVRVRNLVPRVQNSVKDYLCMVLYSVSFVFYLMQGCTNPVNRVAVATKFFTVSPDFLDPQYETSLMSPFWRLEF